MSTIHNLWREFGFRENPFHADPLGATEEDHAIYIRREELETILGTHLASENRGGIFVEGHIGVGKTTFVNQTQLAVHQHDATTLPCDDVVEIQDTTSASDLALSIAASILASLPEHVPSIRKDKHFQLIEEDIRRTRIYTWSGGIQIAGTGIQGSRHTASTQPPTVTLQALIGLLDSLTQLLEKHGLRKAIVVLNNLDNVQRPHLWSLLHDVRDTLLQRRGLVLVFIGPAGLRAELAADVAHRRVSEVLAQRPIQVDSLTALDAWHLIQARIQHYGAPEGRPIAPRAIVQLLHQAGGGELRYILNRLADIIHFVARTTGLRGPMDEATASAALHVLVARDMQACGLTERKMQILKAAVERGSIQPKEHSAIGFKTAQALQPHLKDLHQAGLLDRTLNPNDAREAIYVPRGDAILFFSGEPRRPN